MSTDPAVPEPLRIGIVGFGWMGQLHARAYARLTQHYPAVPRAPRLVAVADTADDDRLTRAVRAYGFRGVHSRWQDLMARDDLDVISVTGPNFLHRDVAVAAAEAGLHVWLEKPAGRDAGETREIAAAVRAAGVCSTVGFNYRNAPAVELARSLVSEGRLGAVRTVSIRMRSDYAADPAGALTWRYRNAEAGSGVLGDLASHGVDLARYVVGEVAEVLADTAVFIGERARPSGVATGHGARGAGPMGRVENEDHVAALLRFAGGARGTLEASRVAVGEQNAYGFEVHGDRGALAWDFRRMGELRLSMDQGYTDASYATRFVGPGDGEAGRFQPGAGIAMSYDDLKVVEAYRLVTAIAGQEPAGPTVEDAVAAADLVDALARSARERRWVTP